MSSESSPASTDEANHAPPKPLNRRQRRILGVLIEKARTTPDAYPMSLNGIVTGANQKSNRYPLMTLSTEQVDDELIAMRGEGLVAEVHGGGRVPKYRHFGYDYMGVKGVEAAVMAELLLRGAQTAGELRTRASRFEPIADMPTLDGILQRLIERKLVIALTPAGRGQIFTHNLYLPEELQRLKAEIGQRPAESEGVTTEAASRSSASSASSALQQEVELLQAEVEELRGMVEQLASRVASLEGDA